jgi:preprotein translocase subunit SecB
LHFVSLLDVRVFKLLSEGTVPLADGPFEVQSNLAVRAEQRDGFIDAYSLYQVEAIAADESQAWSVRLEMVGTWTVEAGAPDFDDEHLNCFAFAIGSMTLHPYARENVQSAVSRLGYPPFTLDMISSPTGGADDDVVEISPSEPLDFSV